MSRYLEVTYREGKPLAAYFHLPHQGSGRSVRCEEHETGLVVDFNEEGKPLGVEIIAPSHFSLENLNRILSLIQEEPAKPQDVAPLAAASAAA